MGGETALNLRFSPSIYPMTENTTMIDNRSIRIYEMRNFRNDSLTGSLLRFHYDGNLRTMILNIKKIRIFYQINIWSMGTQMQ